MQFLTLVFFGATCLLQNCTGLKCYECNNFPGSIWKEQCLSEAVKVATTWTPDSATTYCHTDYVKTAKILVRSYLKNEQLGLAGKCVSLKDKKEDTERCYCNTDLCNKDDPSKKNANLGGIQAKSTQVAFMINFLTLFVCNLPF